MQELKFDIEKNPEFVQDTSPADAHIIYHNKSWRNNTMNVLAIRNERRRQYPLLTKQIHTPYWRIQKICR